LPKPDYWTSVQNGTLHQMQREIIAAMDVYLWIVIGDGDPREVEETYCRFYKKVCDDCHITDEDWQAIREETTRHYS